MHAPAPHSDPVDVRVSSFCSGGGCVGIVSGEDGVAIVDTKGVGGPRLRFSHHEWAVFVGGVKNGEIDFGL